MKQSFRMKHRNIISLVMAFVFTACIIGAGYKGWLKENINVQFTAFASREVALTIYYAQDAKDNFSAEKKVTKRISRGGNDVKIIIPAKKLAKFKLVMNLRPGVINISKLRVNGRVTAKLDDYASNKYINFDSVELIADGSITLISEQVDPAIIINKQFNMYPGFDVDWIKLSVFGGVLYAVFYAFFMLALYKKKKKRKEFYDYY